VQGEAVPVKFEVRFKYTFYCKFKYQTEIFQRFLVSNLVFIL